MASAAHPLDPLTADEIRQVAAILRRDQGVGDRWRFASIELASRPRRRSATHRRRRDRAARPVVICWNRETAVQGARRARRRPRRRLGAPARRAAEHDRRRVPRVRRDAAGDPRVIEALARRGITDLDRVLIDTWAYGAHLVPEAHRGGRVGWADVWYRARRARTRTRTRSPGCTSSSTSTRMELLEIEDDRRVEEPATMGEYVPRLVPGLQQRADLKPLDVAQPEGVRSRSTATGCGGRSGRCGSASTTARGWSCTRSATTAARSRTGCRSRRWWSPTATRPPTTTAAPRSTSASGGWAS